MPAESLKQCLMCRSGPERWSPFETISPLRQPIRYVRCQDCGLVFQNPRPSPSSLTEYYTADYRLQVQGQENPTAKDRWAQTQRAQHILRLARPFLERVQNHLDIGSSLGEMLAAFHGEFSSAGVGIEPGREYRRQSQARGQRVYEDLSALPPGARRSFDLVTMAHVVEHLPDPLGYLRNLREEWMNPVGHLIVEVPNLLWHPSLEASHLTAYDERSLSSLLRAAGYRVMMIRAHGKPHSRILPLFISAVAEARSEEVAQAVDIRPARGVRFRRTLGQFIVRFARTLGLLLLGRRRLSPWEG